MSEELPKDLQEILDKKGDTPLLEPKLYEMMIGNGKITSIFKEALKGSDLTLEDFDKRQMEMANFINKLGDKVSKLVDDEGNYKTTPATENVEMPPPVKLEEINEMLLKRIQEKNASKQEKIKKETDEICLEIAGIAGKDISEWEISLVVDQLQIFALNWQKTGVGQAVKK